VDPIAVAPELVAYNFTLRFLHTAQLPGHLHAEVLEELCDMQFLQRLTANRVINWHPQTTKFVPLRIRADGNCLVHAACAAMWGIQDRDRTVRRALFHGLLSDPGYNQRWKEWERRADLKIGEVACSTQSELREWMQDAAVRHQSEWQRLVEWASQDSASLSNLHVFVLANVLRRPILIAGEDEVSLGGGLSFGNTLRGLYLPLLWEGKDCVKEPICLAHADGHFWALVPCGTKAIAVLPLETAMSEPITVHYVTPEEDPNLLMRRYMEVFELDSSPVLATSLTLNPQPHLEALTTAFIAATQEKPGIHNPGTALH